MLKPRPRSSWSNTLSGLFEKLDTKICIGQGYRGKTGKLGVGACTCKFEHNVKGCPPTENQIYDFLKQYILGENK